MDTAQDGMSYIQSDRMRKVLVIKSLDHSTYTFETNFSEFLDSLRNHGESDSRELQRTLHNFLMSSSTLIEHTRIMSRKLPEIQELYERKIQETFVGFGLAIFVKDLRNYVTHYSVPLTMTKLELDDEKNIVGRRVIDRQTLLKWSGWSKNAKKFLTDISGDLVLYDLFVEHYNTVAEFHNWLEDLLKNVYNEYLTEYEEFEKRFRLS